MMNRYNQNMVKTTRDDEDGSIDFKSLVEENPVIVFACKGCFLRPSVGSLLQSIGANPKVFEMEHKDMEFVAQELKKVVDARPGRGSPAPAQMMHLEFPSVFIGGQWFGGLDRLIHAHMTAELTPLLRQAGALWL